MRRNHIITEARSCRAVLAVVVSCVALAGCRASTDRSDDSTVPGAATVVRVVDGDTVIVDFGGTEERLRLIGIDTPESVKPDTPVECFGHEASELTATLLPEGTAVRVVRDAEARDDYGRLLGYLYRTSDQLFVNLEIISKGYARPLTISPNDTYAADFVAAARDAEAADLGLWGACTG